MRLKDDATPEEVIKAIICNYSSYSPTRFDALRTLFLVSGNGAAWSTSGNILITISNNMIPKDDQIKSLEETMNLFSSYHNPEITEMLQFKIDYLKEKLIFTKENIDLISSTYFYYEESQKPTYFSLGDYAPNDFLNNIPKNANPAWKSIIFEFISLIISDISEIYLIGEPNNSSGWNKPEAFSIYKSLNFVLNKL